MGHGDRHAPGRRRGPERQSHHAAARRRRRRRCRDALGLPRAAQLAVRDGVGWKHALRRQHRCDRRLPLSGGRDRDHRSRREDRRPAGRADQSPLDQGRHRQPGRHQALCDGRIEQQCRRERHGGRGEPRRRARDRSRQADRRGCSPRGCETRTASPGSPTAARSGWPSTSATRSAATSCRTT